MEKTKLFTEYCTGCGLCHSVLDVPFEEDKKEYLSPKLTKKEVSLCNKVCPASGNALKHYQDGSVWGIIRSSALGWSADEEIRKDSSSGGVITTLCVYLLDNHLVDGIIQTKRSTNDIRKTITVVNRKKEEVFKCMGSRYTSSSPLMNLNEMIQGHETYAFVGKPCDVSALRIYIDEIKPEWKQHIKYIFSFFCAGQPSIDANNKLVRALGGNNLGDCLDLLYRGNGWPGFATLTKIDGTQQKMDYETSWMKILGRDVRKICRFCADGTGELADISCGDAWFLDANGKPDFTERPGRNVVFARTEAGEALLKDALDKKMIILEDFDPERDGLRKMQPYHYTRKASLYTYKWALRICGRIFPNYDNEKLRGFAKGFSIKQKLLRFGGTVQRVLKGTI